jgi:hypothetical protein
VASYGIIEDHFWKMSMGISEQYFKGYWSDVSNKTLPDGGKMVSLLLKMHLFFGRKK